MNKIETIDEAIHELYKDRTVVAGTITGSIVLFEYDGCIVRRPLYSGTSDAVSLPEKCESEKWEVWSVDEFTVRE